MGLELILKRHHITIDPALAADAGVGRPSKAQPSELTWHVLVRGSLNWHQIMHNFFHLDDLARINRAWLHKDLKVSVLQAMAGWLRRVSIIKVLNQ